MKIAIASDHAGFRLKEHLKKMLEKSGFGVLDYGTHSESSADYPEYAGKVAKTVSKGTAERGVLVCWTGTGMCIAANKVKGVRAAVCRDAEDAKLSREHNDANVLCIGSKKTSPEKAEGILKVWLSTEFAGGRHERRVGKISALEK